jgi:hypothetical protein
MTKTIYNVHIFREMRLFYPGIEATTHEEAAQQAAAQPSETAAYTEPCDGTDLSALIDVAGDLEYTNTKRIDFQAAIAIDSYDQLMNAGQAVVDNWENGDLAAAVRSLEEAILAARGRT